MAWGKVLKIVIGSGQDALTAELNSTGLPDLDPLTLTAADNAVSEGSAVDLTGLTVGFRITRSNKFSENQCELNIANISDATIARFINLEDTSITIEAGYQDDGAALIFTGFVTSAVPEWSGADRMLNIIAKTIRAKGYTKDENKGLSLEMAMGREKRKIVSTTYMNMSYAPGAKLYDIALALATNLGVTLTVFGDISGFTRPNGFNYVGHVGGILHNLADFLLSEGYYYTLNLAELVIYPVNDSTTFLEVPALSYDTGLLRVGHVQNYEVDATQIEAFPPKLVWEVETILNPKLTPNGIVQIKADALEGFFLIECVDFHGDTEDGEFNCTMVVSKQ